MRRLWARYQCRANISHGLWLSRDIVDLSTYGKRCYDSAHEQNIFRCWRVSALAESNT